MPSILKPSRADQACIGIAFCFLYYHLNNFREQRTDVQIPNIRPCVSSSANLHYMALVVGLFPRPKIVSFVGLEKQTVPIPTQQTMPAPMEQKVPCQLSKLCLHLRSKQYPYLLSKQTRTYSVNSTSPRTYSVNSTRPYSVNSTRTYSVNSTCTYSPFERFSVCATHVFELMKRRM